jgi:hypothetical protein
MIKNDDFVGNLTKISMKNSKKLLSFVLKSCWRAALNPLGGPHAVRLG